MKIVGPAAGSAKQDPFGLAELTKMCDFTGRTVAITGGTGVMGSEITRALVGCGAQVAVLYNNVEHGQALVEKLGERGKQISLFQCSVLDSESVARAAVDVVSGFGKIDCLINGAGGNKP